ncbi:MAG: nucleotidyltransferase domain-containing protein [Clostridia bacterium]|nr:nucleotidyltransferase domain-containing protein [Clostridia bacterium]
MIDTTVWIESFLQALDACFGARVWFVGLQGSYSRGEATETSDIDTVVILDQLDAEDVKAYHAMLDTLPHRELMCGFLSGKEELFNWDAADLFQFYHDTKPIRGSLDALLAVIDDAAVGRAVKLGACNIYHGCVHNMLYDKSEDIVRGLYKAASFVVQAIFFRQTGKYIGRQKDLLEAVSEEEREIVKISMQLKNGGAVEFDRMSEMLFAWAKKWVNQ